MLKQAAYVALMAILLLLILKRQRSIGREKFDNEYDFIVGEFSLLLCTEIYASLIIRQPLELISP